jgi:hypothetical protein
MKHFVKEEVIKPHARNQDDQEVSGFQGIKNNLIRTWNKYASEYLHISDINDEKLNQAITKEKLNQFKVENGLADAPKEQPQQQSKATQKGPEKKKFSEIAREAYKEMEKSINNASVQKSEDKDREASVTLYAIVEKKMRQTGGKQK